MVNIRKYTKGDEEKIISLYNQVFGRIKEAAYWNWEFVENPAGESIIIVAEGDSKIIGQSTLLPSKMTIKGKSVIGGQSIDTMVSKDYRRQGIYEKMAFKSYGIAAEKDILFGFRFPTGAALEGALEKLGGILVSGIPIYMNVYRLDNFLTAIVKVRPLAKILSLPGVLIAKLLYKETRINIKENYITKEIDEFNHEFDILWDKLKESSPIMSNRDSSFLNWRIKNHPMNKYKTIGAYLNDELVGYIVLKLEKRKIKDRFELKLGNIVDIVGINEEVMATLYYKSKEYFKEEKIDFVTSWITDSMKYKDLFIKLGFFKSKTTIPFVVKNFIEDKELKDLITKEESWYLMPIESDFY